MSPVTGLWSSIKAGPRRRGGAWEKVRRNEIWIRMWEKERNEIRCVRPSPEEQGLRGGEGPDWTGDVGVEGKGRGANGRSLRSFRTRGREVSLSREGGALIPVLAAASRPAPSCGTSYSRCCCSPLPRCPPPLQPRSAMVTSRRAPQVF